MHVSHVCCSCSIARIMRVVISLLHESIFEHSRHEEPHSNSNQESFPHGTMDLVPHLLIKQMQLLNPSDVVFLHW